jgi:FdhD protein
MDLPPFGRLSSVRTSIWNWRDGAGTWNADDLAVEEPLEIRIDGRPLSVTMRTPGSDDELALGFLLTEQVIRGAGDVQRVSRCDARKACGKAAGNVVNVRLARGITVDFERLTRHVFASSSCGLCGKATIAALAQRFPPVASRVRFRASLIASLPGSMRASQVAFGRTGGLHAAALFDEQGTMLVLREDVGRHNAVDKVLGHAVAHGWLPLDRHVLLVSGRSSFEIMQKALAGGVPVVAAVSAPSSLAVDLAQRNGQTLVGFLRDNRMNVYSHGQRIEEAACSTNTTRTARPVSTTKLSLSIPPRA